jgi:hypothetical protein
MPQPFQCVRLVPVSPLISLSPSRLMISLWIQGTGGVVGANENDVRGMQSCRAQPITTQSKNKISDQTFRPFPRPKSEAPLSQPPAHSAQTGPCCPSISSNESWLPSFACNWVE